MSNTSSSRSSSGSGGGGGLASRLPTGLARPVVGVGASGEGTGFEGSLLPLNDFSSSSAASTLISGGAAANTMHEGRLREGGEEAERLHKDETLAHSHAQRGRAFGFNTNVSSNNNNDNNSSSGSSNNNTGFNTTEGSRLTQLSSAAAGLRANQNSRGSRLGAQMGKRAAASSGFNQSGLSNENEARASSPSVSSASPSTSTGAQASMQSWEQTPSPLSRAHAAQGSPLTKFHYNGGSNSSSGNSSASSSSGQAGMPIPPNASTPPKPRRAQTLDRDFNEGMLPMSARAPAVANTRAAFSSSSSSSPSESQGTRTDSVGMARTTSTSSSSKAASSNNLSNTPGTLSRSRGAGVSVAALAAQWDNNTSSPSPSPSKGRQDVPLLTEQGLGMVRRTSETLTGKGEGRDESSGASSGDTNRTRGNDSSKHAELERIEKPITMGTPSRLETPLPSRPSTESAETDSTIGPPAGDEARNEERGEGLTTMTAGLKTDRAASNEKASRRWPLGESNNGNDAFTGAFSHANSYDSPHIRTFAASRFANESMRSGDRYHDDKQIGEASSLSNASADDWHVDLRASGGSSSSARPSSSSLSPPMEMVEEIDTQGQRRLSRAASYGNMEGEMERQMQTRRGEGSWSSNSSSMSSSSASGGPKVGRLSRLQYNKAEGVSYHPGASGAANWDTRPNASSSAKRSSYMRQSSNPNLLFDYQRGTYVERGPLSARGSGSVSPLPRDSLSGGRKSAEPRSGSGSETPLSPTGAQRELLLPSLSGLRADGATSPSPFSPTASQRWQQGMSYNQQQQQQQLQYQQQQRQRQEGFGNDSFASSGSAAASIASAGAPETTPSDPATMSSPPGIALSHDEGVEAVSSVSTPRESVDVAGAQSSRRLHARDSRVSPGYAVLPHSPTVGQLSDADIVQLGAVPGSTPESLLNASGAPLSSKNVLTIALQKAQSAVLLDSANNVPDAIAAYRQAVRLLQEVMERISPKASKSRKHSREEERRRLKVIHDTYAERIRLLSIIYSPDEDSVELSEPQSGTEGTEEGTNRTELESDAEDAALSSTPLIAIQQHISSDSDVQRAGAAGEVRLQRSDSDSSFRSARALRSSVLGALRVPADSSMLKTSPVMTEEDVRTPTTPYFDVDPNLISLGDESMASNVSDGSDRDQSQQQSRSLWSMAPPSSPPQQNLASMNRGRRHANQGRAAGSLSSILLSQEDAMHRTTTSNSRRNERRPSSEGLELANQQKLFKLEQADKPREIDASAEPKNSFRFPASGGESGDGHQKSNVVGREPLKEEQQQQQPQATTELAPSQSNIGSAESSSSLRTVRPRANTSVAQSSQPLLVNASPATGTIHQRRRQVGSGADHARNPNSSPSLSSSSSPAIGSMPSPDPSAPVSADVDASTPEAAPAMVTEAKSMSTATTSPTEATGTAAGESAKSSLFTSGRKRAASQPSNRRPSIPQAFLMGHTAPGQPHGPPPVPRITRKASMPLSPLSPSAPSGPPAGLRVVASTNAANAAIDRGAGGQMEQLRFPSPAPSVSSGYHALGTPISPYGSATWIGGAGKLGGAGATTANTNATALPTIADVFPTGLPSMHFAGPTFASNGHMTPLPWLGIAASLPEPSTFLPTAPFDAVLKPFHTMRLLLLSMQRGAYLSQRLYVPRDLWLQPGGSARLLALDTKIKMFEIVASGLDAVEVAGRPLCKPPSGQNPGMEAMFASRFAKQLEDFDGVLVEVQNTLAKKLGFVDGWSVTSSAGSGSNSVGGGKKGANLTDGGGGSGTGGGSGIFGSKFSRGLDRLAGGGGGGGNSSSASASTTGGGEAMHASLSSSSSTIVSDLPAGGYVDVLSRTFARSHSMARHFEALRRSTGKKSASPTSPIKDDSASLSVTSPSSIFPAQPVGAQDSAMLPSEEAYAALPTELKAHIEAKLKRASVFFANAVLRIVFKDLAILMDRFVKKNSALISE